MKSHHETTPQKTPQKTKIKTKYIKNQSLVVITGVMCVVVGIGSCVAWIVIAHPSTPIVVLKAFEAFQQISVDRVVMFIVVSGVLQVSWNS